LSDASILWMGEKIITLEQAATIWLSPDEETPVSRPLFNKQEITEFWINEIEHRKHIRGTKARVIAKLLSILDRQGECPSVVRNPGFNECNNELNEDQFTRLSKIPLWRHSLSVASTIAGRTERAASVADAIIVALGHDLGKIPAYHEKTYATGDHPIISAAILNQISEFTSLANHLDLANAVRSHHNLGNTQGHLAGLLKACDSTVRVQEDAEEMGRIIAANSAKPLAAGKIVKTVQPVQSPAPPLPGTNATTAAAAGKSGGDIKTVTTSEVKNETTEYSPVKTDISWLDLDELLEAINERINKLINNRWEIFSMRDGRVYVPIESLWKLIKHVAPEDHTGKLNLYDTIDKEEKKKHSLQHRYGPYIREKRCGYIHNIRKTLL